MIWLLLLAIIAWVGYGFVMSILCFQTFVFGGLNRLGWVIFGPGFLLMKLVINIISNNAADKVFKAVAKPFGGLKW